MGKYVFRRTIQAIPILIAVSLLVFMIVWLAPGSPLDRFYDPRVPREAMQALIEAYGLDKPVGEQYVRWATTFWQVWQPESWGYSFLDGSSVRDKYIDHAGPTLRLMGTALIVTILFAIPIGTLAAVKQYSWTDKIITTLATVGYAMPSFLIGLALLYIFARVLGWFPIFGMQSLTDARSPTGTRGDFIDLAWHLALPVASLAIQQIAGWARYMRSSMLEVLHQDYVRTAKAKGLSSTRVLGKHALRNALIPVVTLLGLSIPGLIGGAAITETIFSYPGLGKLYVEAVAQRDYPVVMAGTMIGAVAVVVGNLLADVLYAVVDPRIKY